MRKSKNQDPRELKMQADMLTIITKCLEKYMRYKLKMVDAKVDGRALDMAQNGVIDFFNYYHEIQGEPNNTQEKAKLEKIGKYAGGLLDHLQAPARIPTEYLDNGGAKTIDYLEGNPALLHETMLNDLEEFLEPLPVVQEDYSKEEGEPLDRLDLFALNQILRRIQAWSVDAQSRLAFAGKPKGGGAIGNPRRCLIRSIMTTWELATGLPAREGYHGTHNHGPYNGILYLITRGCLIVAGDRLQSSHALGEEMDQVRLMRGKKAVNFLGFTSARP